METNVPFQPSSNHKLEALSSRIRELEETATHTEREYSAIDAPSSSLLRECAAELEINVMQIVEDCSNVSSLRTGELDAYLNHLTEELSRTEAKSAKISEEIEIISRKTNEDFLQFESNMQELNCSLEHIPWQTAEGEIEKYPNLTLASADNNVLQAKIVNQIVKQNEENLRVLEEYDNLLERWEAVKEVENLFSCTEVIDFVGNNIHLLLKSYVHETNHPIEILHEMVIEVHPKSMDIINVKISPNDVYIDEVAKSLSNSDFDTALTNPLERLVGKVQQRIVRYYARQRVADDINRNPKSSCKYVDKDEVFVVQLPGEVNACIKVAQGWPVLSSPLQLISLKGKKSKGSALFQKVNDSLHLKDKWYLASFIDAIDDAVGKHM